MLNYIIPPIVIVLSLAALIMFLFRKNAKISEELILQERRKGIPGFGSDKKKIFRITQIILRLTEKGTQYFKLISLKFYNKSDNWFHSVKERREKISSMKKEQEEAKKEFEAQIRPRGEVVFRRRKEVAVDNVIIKKEEELDIKPMISDEVVHPDSKFGPRNEFERALIERIALNPRDVEAYERLGDYYIESGNFNDSLSCFEEVLRLSPVNRKAKVKVKRLQKIVFSNLNE
jgi:tetratricopeptide (TPR) repeat protein